MQFNMILKNLDKNNIIYEMNIKREIFFGKKTWHFSVVSAVDGPNLHTKLWHHHTLFGSVWVNSNTEPNSASSWKDTKQAVSAVEGGSVAGYQGGCFAVFVKYWLLLATPRKGLQRHERSL